MDEVREVYNQELKEKAQLARSAKHKVTHKQSKLSQPLTQAQINKLHGKVVTKMLIPSYAQFKAMPKEVQKETLAKLLEHYTNKEIITAWGGKGSRLYDFKYRLGLSACPSRSKTPKPKQPAQFISPDIRVEQYEAQIKQLKAENKQHNSDFNTLMEKFITLGEDKIELQNAYSNLEQAYIVLKQKLTIAPPVQQPYTRPTGFSISIRGDYSGDTMEQMLNCISLKDDTQYIIDLLIQEKETDI